MNDASFASLSPRLLARKGGARPAMRSQAGLAHSMAKVQESDLEDLGWNDLGDDAHDNPAAGTISTASAEVIAIAARKPVAKTAPASPPSSLPAKRSKRAPSDSTVARDKADRAAFTLRLDAERHLRLRLACTLRQRSAQQLVTEALDALLSGMADVQNLAAQVSARPAHSQGGPA
ncbi:hypothetical protein EYB45_10035 [Erythrobacteraceae bacterium CFH 75059]|uniref:hypothetical protein n=1 Tax=Qipengyuania thermophila TaxID=2509361 RepID=UPI0010228195|nr:hypothetical protein [Qipengyuania thermophila]TCD02017.1 hypothetical protein EYB45_10035 [Erythrobacteraceae bacterium CFH 75059]